MENDNAARTLSDRARRNGRKRTEKRFDRFCAEETPDALLFDPAGRPVEAVRRFTNEVQAKNVALIFKNDIGLALRLPADGVQIPYQPDIKKSENKRRTFLWALSAPHATKPCAPENPEPIISALTRRTRRI